MQFGEIPDEREADPESGVLPAVRPPSSWVKRSKTWGRNSRRDAGAGVLDAERNLMPFAIERHLDAAADWRELHRVREQIPDDLLEACGIAGTIASPARA